MRGILLAFMASCMSFAHADKSPCLPDTFDAAIACLDERLAPDDRQRMATMPYAELPLTHFGLGMWIRNSWLYGDRTELAANMTEMGFQHVDDMSGTIVEAYWAQARGCAFDVNAYLAYYNDYWANDVWIEGEPDPETGIIPMSRSDEYSPVKTPKPIPSCPFEIDEPISPQPSVDDL